MDRQATAFVPGHVTGFFSVHRTEQAVDSGSRGGGITTADGVTVRVTDESDRAITYQAPGAAGAVETDIEPVATVVDELGITAEVTITSSLPMGAGFGISGAASLGTALAGGVVAEESWTERELRELAHVAEVRASTGLGDVVAQAYGGMPLRLDPGAHGDLDGIPGCGRIEYCSFGEYSTKEVLTGDTSTITEAGEDALASVVESPSLDQFFSASRAFAEKTGLLTDRLREVIENVDDAGGQATMAMLGETVVAPGYGLTDAGYDPESTQIDTGGASLCHDDPTDSGNF